MKVRVREPFAVHIPRFRDKTLPNGKVVQEYISDESYFGDAKHTFEATPAQVLAHLHKLEAADEESRKFISDIYERQIAARKHLQPSEPDQTQAIATAVVQALVAAGLVAKK